MAYLCRHSSFINKTVSLRRVTQCRCWRSHIPGNVPPVGVSRRFVVHHHSSRIQPATYVAAKFTSSDDNWKCSNLYYKSKYLYIQSTQSSLSLYQDFLIKRPYHTTAQLLTEASKDLKQKESSDSVSSSKTDGDKTNVENVESAKGAAVVPKKETLRDKIIGFIQHYYNGFKLFFVELRICIPLMYKYLKSGRSSLKRREHMQLTKTLGDVFRVMPLIPMLIIPFAELLIPFYVKLGLMPTTFQSKKDKEEQSKIRLKKKIEWAKLITETLANMPKKKPKDEGMTTLHDFTQFMEKVKSRQVQPTTEEIVRFSCLFEDEITMQHLSMRQLQALCHVLGLELTAQIPSEKILRFQLRMRLRELEVDDKLIQKEGIDSLTIPELQSAVRNRGMRAYGMSEERLKAQLEQWLELHLHKKVPSSLLLLSRTMYLERELSPAEQLKQTISALPEEAVETTKITSAVESGVKIDNKTRLEMVKKEAKELKAEQEADKKEKAAAQLKAQQAEMLKAQAEAQARAAEAEAKAFGLAQAAVEPKPVEPMAVEKEIVEKEVPVADIAEPIVAKPREEKKEVKGEVLEAAGAEVEAVEEEVTPKDIGDLEAVIEHITLHEKEELQDVKEDIDEYKENLQQMKALSYPRTEVKETAAAKTLRIYVDKLLSGADKIIDDLQQDRIALKEKIEFTEVKLKYEDEGREDELIEKLEQKKEHLISINEVLLALKRLQKVPDDMKWQKILQVLDEDEDGYIDIKNILEVTEALGRENLKLGTSAVHNMVRLLRKEAEIAFEEKLKVKMEKEEIKDKVQNVADSGKEQSVNDPKIEQGGKEYEIDQDSVKEYKIDHEKLGEAVEEPEKVKSEEKSG